jgi:uncharacterized protein YkwD
MLEGAMAIEDRDWYRETHRPQEGQWLRSPWFLAVAVLAALVIAGVALQLARGKQPTFGGEQQTIHGRTSLSILPGLPALSLGGDGLYPDGDVWQAYLAPERVCPGAERTDLPLSEQADTMACLINYARTKHGLAPLTAVTVLNTSSLAKARKIESCREFVHAPCGENPSADASAAGYRGAWGENLYLADGRWGAARVALDGWLNSDGHRTNLFRPEWRTHGIAAMRLDRFGEHRDVTIWVNQFGTSS